MFNKILNFLKISEVYRILLKFIEDSRKIWPNLEYSRNFSKILNVFEGLN